jgi:putative ubiquitin-RnfH superfamily antitoxin RatB of RatAB toxin-antitoxin module
MLRVSVAYAAPGVERLVPLELADGATVADAVAASALVQTLGLDATALGLAIFGEAARADTPLLDGDRVELTRPLLLDPKRARRDRALASPLAPQRRPKKRRGGPAA